MAWLGMNDDEVNAQGNVLQQQAEAIQQLITKVDQEVESLKQNWQGDDSRQFEQEWTGTHRPELQKAQKAAHRDEGDDRPRGPAAARDLRSVLITAITPPTQRTSEGTLTMAVYKKGMDADAVSAPATSSSATRASSTASSRPSAARSRRSGATGAARTPSSSSPTGTASARSSPRPATSSTRWAARPGPTPRRRSRRRAADVSTPPATPRGRRGSGHVGWSLHRGGAATFRCVRARRDGESARARRCVRRSAP